MKRNIRVVAMTFLVIALGGSGCSKSGGSATNPISALPDVANLLLKASTTFVKGAAALLTLSAPNLSDGTYTVNYSLGGGYNMGSGLSTSMTISGGTGTFQTQSLSSAGPTSVTINSITNSAGATATVSSGNVSNMFDSTGQMSATYTPASGSGSSFSATDVTATLTGNMLVIEGVMWTPNLTTISLTNYIYSGSTGAVNFNANDLTPGNSNSVFNGAASYGVSGTGITISDLASRGSITINTTTPTLTGTFTYKNQDSSMVSGTFNCLHP
jgi:hypothetical protein